MNESGAVLLALSHSNEKEHVKLTSIALTFLPFTHLQIQQSDYMVHRRADYMVSVHMYSSRTLPARCVNSQGKKNSRIGDGVTSIYVTGDEVRNRQKDSPIPLILC